MRLRAFLRCIIECLRRGHARRRRRQRKLARVRRKRPRAVIGVGTRKLGVDVHVRELVLDRLIGSDQAPEGIALHRVILRHREADIGAADLFERGHDRRAVEHARRDLPAFARFAQCFGRCIVEHDLRMLARGIDGIFHSTLHAPRL